MSIYKPAIGIDIDGVIGDSDKIFRKYIKKFFGFELKRKDVKSFFYEKVLGIPQKKMSEFWKYFTENRKWLEIPLLTGAKTAIDYLKEKYQLVIITARPESVRELTLEWLKEKNIPYDRIFFIQEKKGEKKLQKIFSNGITLKCVIDDRLDVAMDFIKANIRVLLFDYPWNQTKKKMSKDLLIRVKGWQEALSYL